MSKKPHTSGRPTFRSGSFVAASGKARNPWRTTDNLVHPVTVRLARI